MSYGDVEVKARVAVIGVGGAGCSVVSDIYKAYPEADAIAVNTDRDALHNTDADLKLYICKSVTKGEGTKGDSLLGRRCAQAHLEEIKRAVSGYDAVFIVAGMGGGTGTGAAPIIAEIAERQNVMTFAIAINPFSFETARQNTAAVGLQKLKSVCPHTLVVENDLAAAKMPDASLKGIFKAVNRSISSFVEEKTKKIEEIFESEFESMIGEGSVEVSENTIMPSIGIGKTNVTE